MQNITLIGGAPCAGKTTLATFLAAEQKSNIAHLDDLREQFQKTHIAQRNQYPWIYSSFGVSAEEFWKDRSPSDVLEVEIQQAREFWPTVKEYIQSGQYGILEGVQILPELVRRDFSDSIHAVFLLDADEDRVRQTIFSRGLWNDAETYADWIKPLEFEWVKLHNTWLEHEAQRHNFPIIKVHDRSKVLAEATRVLSEQKSDDGV